MNNFFKLQLFADDPAAGSENSQTAENTASDQTKKDTHVSFTQEQQDYIDQLVDRAYARASRKASKEAAEQTRKQAREEAEAERLKNMSDAERTAEQIRTMQEKLNQLEAEKTHNTMIAAAREELGKRGYSFSDEIVRQLVGEDADATKSAIDSFTKAFDSAVKEAVKKAVPSTEPKAGTVSTMTKDQIMAIKNTAERQKAISENINLFR